MGEGEFFGDDVAQSQPVRRVQARSVTDPIVRDVGLGAIGQADR